MIFINTPQKYFLTLSALLFVILLSGCAQAIQKKQVTPLKKNLNYNTTSVNTESSLAVPPSLTKPSTSELFAKDRQIVKKASRILNNESTSETLIQDSENVKVKKLGAYRWLEVKAPQKQVFQTAKKFLLDLGFDLALDDASVNLLETKWKENKPNIPKGSLGMVRSALSRALGQVFSQGKIDRFRIRVDTLDANTSQIFITHQSMVEKKVAGSNTWIFAGSDPELEIELSYRLLVYLGLAQKDAKKVVSQSEFSVTKGSKNEKKFNLFETPTGLAYNINESFSRAWLKLGWAIDRSDYIIYDKNRQTGIYYIKPGKTLAKTKQGFLDNLLFWKKNNLDSIKLQVKLKTDAIRNSTQLHIFSENGAKLPKDQAKIFLKDIIKNL